MENPDSLRLMVVPLALVLIGINMYFRLRIMRGFKYLHQQGIQLNPELILNAEKRASILADNPDHKEEIKALARNIEISMKLILGTFLILLGVFLFIYFKQR